MRCLELYSGIGGFAVAAGKLGWQICAAMDISEHAATVYRCNFDHTHEIRTLESVSARDLSAVDAEFWWMSPPCQPYTRRGRGRDLSDPRAASYRSVLHHIAELKPMRLALENVPGFQYSMAARALRSTLRRARYRWREVIVCPTELGVPNRRCRFYLVASRSELPSAPRFQRMPFSLPSVLDEAPSQELYVAPSALREYAEAIHCIGEDDEAAVSSCFTSAYGKSPIRSGSYLAGPQGVRRFSPAEILRCLGFPRSYLLPPELGLRAAWKLVGNSLSIFVVTQLLRSMVVGCVDE